jgi:hypothetical protein
MIAKTSIKRIEFEELVRKCRFGLERVVFHYGRNCKFVLKSVVDRVEKAI